MTAHSEKRYHESLWCFLPSAWLIVDNQLSTYWSRWVEGKTLKVVHNLWFLRTRCLERDSKCGCPNSSEARWEKTSTQEVPWKSNLELMWTVMPLIDLWPQVMPQSLTKSLRRPESSCLTIEDIGKMPGNVLFREPEDMTIGLRSWILWGIHFPVSQKPRTQDRKET